jgi:small-conductance mechanosensitive channel
VPRSGLAALLIAVILCALAASPAAAVAPPPPAGAGAALSQPVTIHPPPPAAPPMASPPAAHAPAKPAPTETAAPRAFDPQIAQQQLTQIQNQIPAASTDALLTQLGQRAAAIEAWANPVVAGRTQALMAVDAKLQKYAFTERHPGTKAQQAARAALLADRRAILAQLVPARRVASAANAAYSQIAERRRAGFSARVLEQSPSPLTPDFWTALATQAGGDLARLEAMAGRALDVAAEASEPQAAVVVAGCLAAGVLLLWPGRWFLLWFLRRKASGGGRLARTAGVVWRVAVDTGLPTLAAVILRLGAEWGGLLSHQAKAVSGAAVAAVAWSAAILALGRAMAAGPDPGRRLLLVSDDTAARMRMHLWAVAVITGAGFLLTRLNYVIGASLAATIAANCLVSLAYAAVAGLILVSFGRGRAAARAPDAGEVSSPIWTLVSLTLGAAIVVTVGAVFAGYTTLAALVSNQIFWLSLIAVVTYLLLRLIDDACDALFRPRGWATRVLVGVFNLRGASVRQTGLLIAVGLQLLILIAALSLALTPFGQSGDLLFARLGRLGGNVRIGSATISPAAIATGIATFVIGMGLVHVARGWLVRRYLPVTGWDAGLRNSVATGVGYLGVAIACLCAFAASGLGMSQIALIASALSVGVGFGLQQVVQNFASGVILLIERPVKVGDWVNVGGVEGDIQRIRVRATEILTGDRSTVIVPNSDLITKQVQNKTLGDPRGLVQIKLPVGNAADARRAPQLIIAAARANPEVIPDPAPVVQIDSIEPGGVVKLACNLGVANPRDAYRIRSDLYFAILEAFEANGISLVPYVGAAAPAPPPRPARNGPQPPPSPPDPGDQGRAGADH